MEAWGPAGKILETDCGQAITSATRMLPSEGAAQRHREALAKVPRKPQRQRFSLRCFVLGHRRACGHRSASDDACWKCWGPCIRCGDPLDTMR